MDQTIVIEVTNKKTIDLLEDMEDLGLIRMLKPEHPIAKKSISGKYRGILNEKQGQSLKKHLEKSRKEWSDSF